MTPGAHIVPFVGGPLSQWKTSIFVDVDGVSYMNAEQFMMAQKALVFGDFPSYRKIMSTTDTKYMKNVGRRVKNFDQKTWDAISWQIVFDGNMYKFSQNPAMRGYLLSFPHDCVFAECNPFDSVWGIGLSVDDPLVLDHNNWRGANMLGFVLTKVRDVLLEEEKNKRIL